MFHSLLRRRATIACGNDYWLAKTRAKAAEAQARADADMERLRAALADSGCSVTVSSAGIPDLYDYNGWLDNTRYGAIVHFREAADILAFLDDIGNVLGHLNGPGTADISIKFKHGIPGAEIHFNPLLAGVLANRMERTGRCSESAVGKEVA